MSHILVVTKIFFLSAHKIQNFIQQLFFRNTSCKLSNLKYEVVLKQLYLDVRSLYINYG